MESGEEIELKLQVVDAAVWPALCAFVRGQGQANEPLEMEAVYFDTPQADLRCAHLAYRLRREGVQWIATLKGGGSSAGGLHRRSEWNRPAAGAQPDLTQFADVLEARLARMEACSLHPIVRTAFVRETVLLECGGARIEAALDRGAIEAAGRSAPILELELELKCGGTADVLEFGAQLARRFPLVLESRSKFLRGLLLAGLAKEPHGLVKLPDAPLDAVLALAAHLRDAWKAGVAVNASFCLPRLDYLALFPWKCAAIASGLRDWRQALLEKSADEREFLSVLLCAWQEIVENAGVGA